MELKLPVNCDRPCQIKCPIMKFLDENAAGYRDANPDIAQTAVEGFQAADTVYELEHAAEVLAIKAVEAAYEESSHGYHFNRLTAGVLPDLCDGPTERRRFILFGRKVLTCTSKAASLRWRFQNTSAVN